MMDIVALSLATLGRVIAAQLKPDEMHKLAVAYAGRQSRP
jgi:hypothetical protein